MKIKQWFASHKPTKRRIIQLYAALLFNANLKGFANGRIYQGPLKNLCAPGLNCYSCPGASAACPLGALQNALASSNARLPYYVFGIIILYGILFGRWICGFLCPFGLIQDLIYKIKTPKVKKGRLTRVFSYFKYVILAVFVVALPLIFSGLDFPLPAFCKYICPAGTLEGAIGLLSNQYNTGLLRMLGALFSWKFLLLVIFIVGAVFFYRFFCRFFCPLGALYGLFNKISLIGIKLDKPKCIDCGLCVSKCKMDISHVGDTECINCGECISVCPTKAIEWKGGKIILPKNEIPETASEEEKEKAAKSEKKRLLSIKIISAVLAVSLLAGALFYYNVIDKAPDSSDPSADTGDDGNDNSDGTPKYGYNVGDLCYGEDLEVIKGDGEIFNVENERGKVVVINFWYTTCGPCLEELPHFDEAAKLYKDEVTMIALCANFDASEAPSFVSLRFADYSMSFGLDNEGESYFNLLDGRDAYPKTVIVNAEGVITANINGPVTYDELIGYIEDARSE